MASFTFLCSRYAYLIHDAVDIHSSVDAVSYLATVFVSNFIVACGHVHVGGYISCVYTYVFNHILCAETPSVAAVRLHASILLSF